MLVGSITENDHENMKSIINRISIRKLFGDRDINIDFTSPCRILIGENGIGKTTILSIINLMLNGEFTKLKDYRFESVSVSITHNNTGFEFVLPKDLIEKYATSYRYVCEDVEKEGVDLFIKKLRIDDLKDLSPVRISQIINEDRKCKFLFDSPNISVENILSGFIKEFIVVVKLLVVLNSLNIKTIYLPTYRRIEADLKNLIEDIMHQSSLEYQDMVSRRFFQSNPYSNRHENPYSGKALIRFGMWDIDESIRSMLSSISQASVRGFSTVSGGMLSRLLMKENEMKSNDKLDRKEIEIILQRVGDNISEQDRKKILDIIDNNTLYSYPYLAYFLSSLLTVYSRQRNRDRALKSFANACNKFLIDKRFYYDESHVEMGLFRKSDKHHAQKISLSQLSSGEKQLIAMMAMAHLELSYNLIFLIDEPELSLSLYWQERLLPALSDADACRQILAVTHSPFIFNNEFKDVTQGSPEYITF